jgi:hypothetical protein
LNYIPVFTPPTTQNQTFFFHLLNISSNRA